MGSYANVELRALKFPSEDEIDRAIDLCWSNPVLKGVPNDTPGGITLVVPEEVVRILPRLRPAT